MRGRQPAANAHRDSSSFSFTSIQLPVSCFARLHPTLPQHHRCAHWARTACKELASNKLHRSFTTVQPAIQFSPMEEGHLDRGIFAVCRHINSADGPGLAGWAEKLGLKRQGSSFSGLRGGYLRRPRRLQDLPLLPIVCQMLLCPYSTHRGSHALTK